MPLISNIWGFIFQLLLNDSKITYANTLPLSLLDIVFGSLQGLFVAIVFFSDPTMVDFVRIKFNSLKSKHFNNFGPIRKKRTGEDRLITPTDSLKQPYIITPPTPVLTRSYEDLSADTGSQEIFSRLPSIYIGSTPTDSERRASLQSDYTCVA